MQTGVENRTELGIKPQVMVSSHAATGYFIPAGIENQIELALIQ